MPKSQYVQFGCGLCAPSEWLNFDVSPTLRIQKIPGIKLIFRSVGPQFPANARYGDVVRGLPVPPNSCRGIYSSHVLEHLALDDFRVALKNVYAALQSGGIFRFVVPNLEQLAIDYLACQDADAASQFFRSAHLGMTARPQGLVRLMRDWLGNSRHLWMWDYKGLKAELEGVGFRNIRRAEYGDSIDNMFLLVENPDRWDRLAVGVECRKP